MIQARCKLKLSAFEYVFHASHVNSYEASQYQGYRLFAQDGSNINLRKDERQSLCNIVDATSFTLPTIIIADRGYESYNVFAYIMHAEQKFLIRAKDSNSNGILSGLTLPTTPKFDVTVKFNLTRLQTKAVRANSDYRSLTKQVKFDYLPLGSKTILPFKLRIVKVAVAENTYETLITNLPENEFSMAELQHLYHLRWGIETSFRELKYSLGLAYLRSQRIDLIKQEIYARLTLYNFTRACQICRKFIRDETILIQNLLIKHLLPVRLGRQAPRKLRAHYFKSFLYRIA